MRDCSSLEWELLRPQKGTFSFLSAFDGTPQRIEVQGGRIVSRKPGVIEAGLKKVAPALVDAHCHVLPAGLDLQKLDLSKCSSREEVLQAVSERHAQMGAGEWLMAVHYDQTKYEGGRHLSKHDLDPISADRPILLRHSNGHASVANSGALAAAGVGSSVQDPKGGTFVRDADGSPNGVLLETAHERVSAAAPSPTLEQMVDAIREAATQMAAQGIVEATDMMTGRYNLPLELQAYRLAAEDGPVRFRLCIQWATLFGPRAMPIADELAAFDGDKVAVWGAKIFADGAIGSATAAIHGRFTSDPSSDGTLIYAPDRLKAMVRTAHEAGWKVAIHSIGDRSTDLVMDAYEALDEPSRHRIEHAMILSDAQIDRMARLGIHCTMQPEFLYRFGHSYRHHLGAERASHLKRYRSVKDAGIPLSFSSDRPIVSGDPWLGVFAACERPEGFDPAENLTFEEALHAYTEMGAAANGGSNGLNPGDRAEMVVF